MPSPVSSDVPSISPKTELSSGWFTEWLDANEVHSHRMGKTLVETRTAFQKVVLAESRSFGRCLILDGEMQSAQSDEFIYHEALVQPAMVLHPKPREVLILGGGEGATVREVLRHSAVKRVTMVDIDGEVVEFCRNYLKEWHCGTLGDRRTRLFIGDARAFIEETQEQFDVIISDLPTPLDAGPVYPLYTLEFYRHVLSRLRPGGLLVAQAGSGSLVQLGFHAVLSNTLRQLFSSVRPYYAFVPSFDVPWAFLLASTKTDPRSLNVKAVDRRLGTLRKSLRFYDGETHQGLFHVPKYLRNALEREKRVIRQNKPVVKFGA